MRTDWPEENQEDIDTGDALELYNDEMARNAVGGLFDSDAEADAKPAGGRFVVGFDKPQEAKPASRVPIDLPPPEEENIDEEEMPVVSRRRSPSRPPNPAPRPAVRMTQAHSRDRGTAGSRPVSLNRNDDQNDEFDGFRKRYKNHEAVPSPKPRVERVEKERPEKPAPRRQASNPYANYEEAESLPPLRWVAIALVAVVLIVMAFLVYRITSLSGQLREANELLDGGTVDDAYVTELLLSIEEKDDLISNLERQIEQFTSAEGPGVEWEYPSSDTDGPGENDIEPPPGEGATRPEETPDTPTTPTNGGGLPTEYVVVSGDTLSRIASRFYNNPNAWQRIMDANGLTSTNLSVGQTLIIPAE